MRIRLFLAALLLSSLVGFEIPRPVVIPDGSFGVLQVPAMEIDLPLYTSGGNDQAVVDREDCALIRRWGDGRLIADHSGSRHGDAVWNVNGMQVGGTVFLITRDEAAAFHCTAILQGENTGTAYAYDGREIWPKRGDILCVSCGRDGTTYIAILEYEGVIP